MSRPGAKSDAVRVLIVDDNRDFAENVAGLAPTVAHDHATALQFAATESFDVAIVDQKLPDGRGTELLAELRELLPDLVTMVVTAFVSLDNSLAALRERAFAFVGKDSDPDELVETIARAAENARLRRENRSLRQLHAATLLAIPDFLLLVDRAGLVESVNRSHQALCPGPPQLAIGRPLDDIVAPFVLEQSSLKEWLDRVRSGDAAAELTLELTDHEGAHLIVGLRAVALEAVHQPLVLLRAVDLSERIALERRLAESEHLAALGRLVTSIAHDLRNPLAGIRALSQLLRRSCGGVPRDAENLDEILALADRMSATLSDLLDFARPGTRRDEPLQLAELLASLVVAARLWPAAECHSIELELGQTSPAAVVVLGVRERVEGLFANLLDNALQAAPSGGHIRVTLSVVDDHAEVAIEDDGAGIAAEVLPRLFQPFVTTKTRGTGLGRRSSRRTSTHSVARSRSTARPSWAAHGSRPACRCAAQLAMAAARTRRRRRHRHSARRSPLPRAPRAARHPPRALRHRWAGGRRAVSSRRAGSACCGGCCSRSRRRTRSPANPATASSFPCQARRSSRRTRECRGSAPTAPTAS